MTPPVGCSQKKKKYKGFRWHAEIHRRGAEGRGRLKKRDRPEIDVGVKGVGGEAKEVERGGRWKQSQDFLLQREPQKGKNTWKGQTAASAQGKLKGPIKGETDLIQKKNKLGGKIDKLDPSAEGNGGERVHLRWGPARCACCTGEIDMHVTALFSNSRCRPNTLRKTNVSRGTYSGSSQIRE